MGAGVTLAVLGAILLFAVRGDNGVVDVQTVGLILMVAGAAVIWHARRGSTTEHTVTEVEDATDPKRTRHIVTESTTDRDNI